MDLSRSESDLSAIYDAMACGVVVRNAAGAVVFANAAAKRIFGRPPDELIDAFGHRAGHLLIGEVAHRIMADLRETDTVARLGGDEFALILPGADEGGAGHVAQKIIAALQRPFEIEGAAHEVAISIGIAVSPQHGEDVETLMRRADMAMYVAKTTPGGAAVYAEQQDPEGSNQLAMMAELRHTLETDQLQVVYQPIVS